MVLTPKRNENPTLKGACTFSLRVAKHLVTFRNQGARGSGTLFSLHDESNVIRERN